MFDRIVGVAIRFHGVTFSMEPPARHGDLIRDMGDTPATLQGDQGFVTSRGNFVDRREARALAVLSGQCPKPAHQEELFSEDLW